MAGGCAKKGADTRTDRRTGRTAQITYTTEARRPITQRTKYTPLGKEGIEQSSPPPPPRGNNGAGALVPRGLGWEISSAGVVYCSTVGTMMCKVPYSSCKVVTAHRESPQVPTVRLGGTVQYYAEQHGVQCHAVEHCGHESSSFGPVLQVL